MAASFKILWALVPLRTSTHAGEGGLLPLVYFVVLNLSSTQTRICNIIHFHLFHFDFYFQETVGALFNDVDV